MNIYGESAIMWEFLSSSWKFYMVLAGGLLALAAAMDKIASTELKARLMAILTGEFKLKRMSLSEFVIFYIENTFGRVFVGNHISGSNIAKSLLITIISLLAIVVLFSTSNHVSPFHFFEFAQDRPYPLSTVYTTIVIVIIVLNDLFSFLQTAMFMRFASSIKSFTDMVFLAICDLIITVNIFVFVFPVAFTLILKIDDIVGRRIEIFTATEVHFDGSLNDDRNKSEEMKQRNDESRNADVKTGGFLREPGTLQFDENDPFADKFNRFIKSNSVRVDTQNIEPYVAVGGGVLTNSIGTHIYSASRGINADDVQRVLWKQLGVTLSKESPPKEQSPLIEKLREGKEYKRGTIFLSNGLRDLSLSAQYFAAYGLSHVAQDDFLIIISMHLVEQRIKDLVVRLSPQYLANPKGIDGEFLLICDQMMKFARDVPDISSCKNFSISYVGPALRNIYYWARVIDPPIAPVSVSVFASTGLFIAILFYSSLVLYVATALILKTAWGLGVGRGWFDIEKNPFTVSAGVVITASIPVGWLLSAFISSFSG